MDTNLYLWTKILHIVMVTSWFAGLFYLPRIYVNLAQVDPQGSTAEYQRLVGMSQRLYRFMLPLATLTVLTGLVLYVGFGIGMGAGWMHVKLTCVLLLIGYHHGCGRLLRERMIVSEEIGHIKASAHLPIVQPDRYRSLLEDRLAQGRALGLDEGFLRELFSSIHEASVHTQHTDSK